MSAMTVVRTAAAAALVAAITTFAPPAARAADPPLAGHPCTWDVVSLAGSATWTGTIYGGPIVAPGAAVSMRCSIHLNDSTHSGAAVVSASSLPGPGVTALEPRPITYVAESADIHVICTEATVDATTWYLSAGGWTTNPDSSCVLPDDLDNVFGLLPEPVAFLVGAVLCLLNPTSVCDIIGPFWVEVVDPTICPALVALAPGVPGVVDIRPDGDVSVNGEHWYDCPPYGL